MQDWIQILKYLQILDEMKYLYFKNEENSINIFKINSDFC